MRVPWTARRSNQSILKEINPEYSLKRLMPMLQSFGHLMQRASSLEKTLMLGKTEDRRRMGQQRMRWLDGITDSRGHESAQTQGDSEGQRSLVCWSPWGFKESDITYRMNNKKQLKYSWVIFSAGIRWHTQFRVIQGLLNEGLNVIRRERS